MRIRSRLSKLENKTKRGPIMVWRGLGESTADAAKRAIAERGLTSVEQKAIVVVGWQRDAA